MHILDLVWRSSNALCCIEFYSTILEDQFKDFNWLFEKNDSAMFLGNFIENVKKFMRILNIYTFFSPPYRLFFWNDLQHQEFWNCVYFHPIRVKNIRQRTHMFASEAFSDGFQLRPETKHIYLSQADSYKSARVPFYYH